VADQPEPFPGVFPGTIGAPPDVPAFVTASDLVCVARVRERREQGRVLHLVNGEPVEFRRISATVDVERAVEGTADEQMEVELLELDEPSGLARLEEGARVLLFLVRRDERYTLTDLVTGAVDLGRPGADEVLARLEP
jgi:uncharacterized protein YfaS (alpha-2-macroglobulin family)